MEGNTTLLRNPEEPDEEPRKFAFDYSYWSHDGFEAKEDGYLAPVKPNYCDQVHNYMLSCMLGGLLQGKKDRDDCQKS